MKSFAVAAILILLQASPAGSVESYENFIKNSDLIVRASMLHAELDAVGEKTSWKVTYQVSEVLKGDYDGTELTLYFDSSVLDRADRSGCGSWETHKMLILFLRKSGEGAFSYAGPPLNSPAIIASEANMSVLRTVLYRLNLSSETSWFEIIEKGGTVGLVLIGAFLVVLLVFVILLRRRPKQADGTDEMKSL